MKILIIIDIIDNGGVGIVLRNMLNNINHASYKIDILTSEESSVYEKQLPSYVSVRHLHKKNPAKHLGKFGRYFYAYMREKCPKFILRYFCVHGKYDLAIDFKGNNLNLLTAMKCPKIFWSHKDFSPETNPIEKNVIEQYSKTQIGAVKKKMFIKNLNNLDGVVCISQACKAAFSKRWSYPEERIFVLNNILDVKTIKEKSRETISYIKPEKFTFCCMSRISSGKGIERLLTCAKRLNDEGYAFELNIVGGGETLPEMMKFSEQYGFSNVHFFGNKDNPYPYVLQADAFVYPSETEAYSTATCEALILGMPIITTKTASVPEIFNDGEYGLVTENSEQGIYDAMKSFLDDKNMVKKYGIKAKERLSYFDVENRISAVERYLDEFKKNI